MERPGKGCLRASFLGAVGRHLQVAQPRQPEGALARFSRSATQADHPVLRGDALARLSRRGTLEEPAELPGEALARFSRSAAQGGGQRQEKNGGGNGSAPRPTKCGRNGARRAGTPCKKHSQSRRNMRTRRWPPPSYYDIPCWQRGQS
eukprot:9151521-Pyramimonas_sp.AAC.1